MTNTNDKKDQLSLFGFIEEIKNEEDISYRKKRLHEFPYEYASNICLEYFVIYFQYIHLKNSAYNII